MSFSPNITCPYCGEKYPVNISGFGRSGYNARFKTCRACDKDFTVELWVQACKQDQTVSDGHMDGVKSQIRSTRKYLKKDLAEKVQVLNLLRAIAQQDSATVLALMDAKPIGSC